MTNEEFNLRIEKLTERHEALTQSVEHLAIEIENLVIENAKNDKRIALLVSVMESHERRLENLE